MLVAFVTEYIDQFHCSAFRKIKRLGVELNLIDLAEWNNNRERCYCSFFLCMLVKVRCCAWTITPASSKKTGKLIPRWMAICMF